MALLQVRLAPGSRSATIQRLNRWIDEAAGAHPAPDLLVLPGACDTGGAPPRRAWNPAACEGLRANFAFKAREWGVYLAAGLHVLRDGLPVRCAVLFDADGDLVVSNLAPVRGATADGAERVVPWPTPAGRIAVLDPCHEPPIESRVAAEGAGTAVVAMPCPSGLPESQRRTAEANVAALRNEPTAGPGMFWVVVSEPQAADRTEPAGPEARGTPHEAIPPAALASAGVSGLMTFVRGPDGSILAHGEYARESIHHVNVPLRIEK